MNRAHMLQIVLVAVQVIACIPLTIEVFGDMDPEVISASAAVIGVAMLGSVICAMVRAGQEWKKK